jgi:oxalate decarboxylase/phosphoglucose isomerase-like protein (cupin superfamily)
MKNLLFIITLLLFNSFIKAQTYNAYQILEKKDFYFNQKEFQFEEINITLDETHNYINIESNTLSFHFVIKNKNYTEYKCIESENNEIVYFVEYGRKTTIIRFNYEYKDYVIIIKK